MKILLLFPAVKNQKSRFPYVKIKIGKTHRGNSFFKSHESLRPNKIKGCRGSLKNENRADFLFPEEKMR